MSLIIKDVVAVRLMAASQPNRVDVSIEGVEFEDVLKQVDIIDAISYYGIEELMDAIGENEVRIYLELRKEQNEWDSILSSDEE